MNSFKGVSVLAFVALVAAGAVAASEFQVRFESVMNAEAQPTIDKDYTVKSSDTVKELKAMVGADTGIPQRKFIFMNAKDAAVLEEGKSLADYGIGAGATIKVNYKPGSFISGRMFVESERGTEQVMFKSSADSVASLAASVAKLFGLPEGQVALSFQGKQLDGAKTLADYQLDDDMQVTLSPRQAADGAFPIYVKSHSIDASQTSVDQYLSVKSTDSAATLASEVSKLSGLEADKFYFVLNGQSLEGAKTLADVGASAGSTLDVHYKHH